MTGALFYIILGAVCLLFFWMSHYIEKVDKLEERVVTLEKKK